MTMNRGEPSLGHPFAWQHLGLVAFLFWKLSSDADSFMQIILQIFGPISGSLVCFACYKENQDARLRGTRFDL
jgi:hypothetical protein